MAKAGKDLFSNSPKAGRDRSGDGIEPRNMPRAFELLAALPDDVMADHRQDAPPQARGESTLLGSKVLK